jgi:hypothetical protein
MEGNVHSREGTLHSREWKTHSREVNFRREEGKLGSMNGRKFRQALKRY